MIILNKIKKLYEFFLLMYGKHKEAILYIFFGGLTTLVNLVSYYIITRLILVGNFHDYIELITAITWFISVLFAYVTNKLYVFESNTSGIKELLTEMTKFFSCRIFSGVIDIIFTMLLINILLMNDFLARIFSNILVIIINYIFSKLFIFKKGDN